MLLLMTCSLNFWERKWKEKEPQQKGKKIEAIPIRIRNYTKCLQEYQELEWK